jgi:excisionase family DNA binding protein
VDDHNGEDGDLTVTEAAVQLGMSPTALAELLDRGTLASYLAADGRHRRVRMVDLEAHRDKRFALRQELAQQARERRRPSYGPESTTADVVIVAS